MKDSIFQIIKVKNKFEKQKPFENFQKAFISHR